MTTIDSPRSDQANTQILHPGSRQLFRYWESLRAERACPQRDEIDLRPITRLLANVIILDRPIPGDAIRYKLAGSSVETIFNHRLTDQKVTLGFDSFETKVISENFNIAMARLQPSLIRMRFIGEFGLVTSTEMLALPVLNTAINQIQLFGGVFPFVALEKLVVEKPVRQELVSARVIWTEHNPGDRLLDTAGRTAGQRFQVIQGGLN